MTQTDWERVLDERRAKYVAALGALNLSPGTGARLTCPSCHRVFWMTMPPKCERPVEVGTTFSCATACGYFGVLDSFSPVPELSTPSGFDTTSACSRCEALFATDGVVVRRPCCGIEKPRELMGQAAARIRDTLSKGGELVDRELMLGFLVSEFDGVMRASLAMANENARYFETADTGHPLIAQMRALPESSSFQNLAGARQKFLPTGWDMAKVTKDWITLVRLFQKRHLVAHRLGVVDRDYLDKTSDTEAVLGRRVPLSVAELIDGAHECEQIVVSFFGNFLS